MLIPATNGNRHTANKSVESFTFNFDQNFLFNQTNLLRFILFHSRESSTLADFIQENMWPTPSSSSSSSGDEANHFNLTRVISAKLNKLEDKAQLLNNKILFAFEHLNKTNNLQSVDFNNNNINEIEYNHNEYYLMTTSVAATSNHVNIYENIYLKNIHDSLVAQLNRYLHEINLLKNLLKKK